MSISILEELWQSVILALQQRPLLDYGMAQSSGGVVGCCRWWVLLDTGKTVPANQISGKLSSLKIPAPRVLLLPQNPTSFLCVWGSFCPSSLKGNYESQKPKKATAEGFFSLFPMVLNHCPAGETRDDAPHVPSAVLLLGLTGREGLPTVNQGWKSTWAMLVPSLLLMAKPWEHVCPPLSQGKSCFPHTGEHGQLCWGEKSNLHGSALINFLKDWMCKSINICG